MLAPGTTKLYGTWIPRSVKHAPKGFRKESNLDLVKFSLLNIYEK